MSITAEEHRDATVQASVITTELSREIAAVKPLTAAQEMAIYRLLTSPTFHRHLALLNAMETYISGARGWHR